MTSGKRFRFLTLAVLLAIALCTMAAGFLFLPKWIDPNRLDRQDWADFRRMFVSREGRVIDTGNNNISHSEGQGYGMIFAVAYGDRATFDQMWNWTQKNLQVREDALFAWKWTPDGSGGGSVTDPNNASDGDLLIAWALRRAAIRWKDDRYNTSALEILADLHKICFVYTPAGYSMLPGEYGFIESPETADASPQEEASPESATTTESTGHAEESNAGPTEITTDQDPNEPNPSSSTEEQSELTTTALEQEATAEKKSTSIFTLNASYYVFPALRELAGFTLNQPMHELINGGITLIEQGRFGNFELTPDWVTIGPDGYGLPTGHLGSEFGYNAIRVPLQIAWDNPRSPLLEPFARFWSSIPPGQVAPAVVLLPSDEFGPHPALPGMQAVIAFTMSCVAGAPLRPRQLPGILPDEAYYSASLKMLTKLAASEVPRNLHP
jgi:endo-1,4-beta-D-glucanase Y